MNIAQLDQAIKAVCPIHGVNSDGVIFFCDEATEAEREAAEVLMKANIDALDQNTPAPNPAGFADACKAAAGGIIKANALAVAYPLFFAAVSQQQWSDVNALVIDAKAKGVITDAHYAAFKAAAAENNIPLALP